jgi:hypothetical protein
MEGLATGSLFEQRTGQSNVNEPFRRGANAMTIVLAEIDSAGSSFAKAAASALALGRSKVRKKSVEQW